ncbi:MAG: hypothetical protein OIF32_12470 [Campylobacterales bacterium]|nr:hypothetical protein [Campylobacterales bacterium]
MFSLLKKLGELIERIRKNKALWFTILSVVSILGIVISLIFINLVTSGSKEKVYKKMTVEYKNFYEASVAKRYSELLSYGSLIALNKTVVDAVKNDKMEDVKTTLDDITKIVNRIEGMGEYSIEVMKSDSVKVNSDEIIQLVISQKTPLTGATIERDGLFFATYVPVVSEENVIGIVKVRQRFTYIKNDFISSNKEFAFALRHEFLNGLDMEFRSVNFKKMNEFYSVREREFNNKFYTDALSYKDKVYKDEGFIVDRDFYITSEMLTDIRGRLIGIVYIGESVDSEEGYVHIIQSVINSITMIAMGLVVSVLLFLF